MGGGVGTGRHPPPSGVVSGSGVLSLDRLGEGGSERVGKESDPLSTGRPRVGGNL